MSDQKLSEWPKFKDMTSLYVTSGLDDDPGELLEIAPTMKRITRNGKTYFRMKDCRQIRPDGEWAAMYLWDGYGQEMIRRMKEKSSGDETSHPNPKPVAGDYPQ